MSLLLQGAGSAGLTPWSPARLSGLKLWLDGGSSMWSDVARTTPAVADGTPVAAWDDRSPLGNGVTQATLGKRPLLKAAGAFRTNERAVRFSAADLQTLSRTTATGLDGPSLTHVAVLKRASTANQALVVTGSAAGVGNRMWDTASDKQRLVKENDTVVAVGASNLGTAAFRTIAASYNAAGPDTPTTFVADGAYNAFGITLTLLDGTLVTLYRAGTSHVGIADFGVIKRQASTDRGATWSAASTVLSETAMDLRNLAGGVTSTGRVVLAWGRYTGAVFASIVTAFSDDGGVTWSTPATLATVGAVSYSPTGGLTTTGDGGLLLAWYGDDGVTTSVRTVKSFDGGATWSAPAVAASGLIAGGVGANTAFTEAAFQYVGSSTVIGLVRADNGTTFTQVTSADNGATWSSQGLVTFDAWSGGDPNTPPWLVLQGETVWCFYVNRVTRDLRAVSATRAALRAAGTAAWGATTTVYQLAGVGSTYPTVTTSAGLLVGTVGMDAAGLSSNLESFTWPARALLQVDGATDASAIGAALAYNTGSVLWVGSERDLDLWLDADVAALLVGEFTLDDVRRIAAYYA